MGTKPHRKPLHYVLAHAHVDRVNYPGQLRVLLQPLINSFLQIFLQAFIEVLEHG